VSVLNELCCKHRWQPPRFELMEEVGPAHHKTFRFKVPFTCISFSFKNENVNVLFYKLLSAAYC